ncbi:MAG: universal stress protein [Planctomycetes bacterium]|nr:universal stress protein [Planctomycetota bacterium]
MKAFQHVLVGVDFCGSSGKLTEGARSATLQALRIRAANGARLDFLYSTARHSEEEPCDEANRDAGIQEWGDLCREHGLADPTLIEATDPPWLAIIRRVLTHGHDLVLVAKRNRTRRRDRRMGSVTMKLVRKCPGPVWVVNPSFEHEQGPILAATDLREVGNRAVSMAAEWVRMEKRDLYVVHAWQIPFELQLHASRMGDEDYHRRVREEEQRAREEILAIPGVHAIRDRVHPVIALGAPSERILEVEHRLDPSLSVLGTVGRGGVPGFLMGNTAERLLYKLESSLLVVKPADFVCPVE